MINFMAGLLFVGVFCLNSGAFGALPHDDAGLPSEVVFIDPSVRDAEIIVAQLPQGAEVVRLSPGMDGVAQISAHLTEKRDLSAIRIISHGNAGYFVLNGKRINMDFLRDHGARISPWGRALAENGDILFYACNLAASYEGKAFAGKFANLTGADIAASTDVTGGEAFNGNWNLEYAIGQIGTTALTIGPDIDIKLADRTWNGSNSADWTTGANWDGGVAPVALDSVIIANAGTSPDLSVHVAYLNFTVNSGATLNFVAGGEIDIVGSFTNKGTVNAAGDVPISITVDNWNQLNMNGNITSSTGAVTLDSGINIGIILTGASTITSTSTSTHKFCF